MTVDMTQKKVKPLTRHKIREKVLQALYAVEISNKRADEVFQDLLEPFYQAAIETNEKENAELLKRLFLNTYENREKFDEIINSNIVNWDVDRLPIVEKNIIRMAIHEFLFEDNIPFPVTIDEYVKMTKRFSEEKRAGFMNAVLDNIRKKIVPESSNSN